MIDLGSGPPVVLIPGIQGRWEWMRPAVGALAARCRVLTASLCGDPDSPVPLDAAVGFDGHTGWVDKILERAGLNRAAVCGVSYGGLVALHYAARRPDRVTSLTLASTPSPTWKPTGWVERYVKTPRLLSPVFVMSSPVRLYPEIAAAFPTWLGRTAFAVRCLYQVTRHPPAPTRMAARVRLLEGVDFASDCQRIQTPTLVLTGERDLDRVVPVDGSLEYLRAIAETTYAKLTDTGHIGLMTKPERFADIIGRFIGTHAHDR